MGALDSLCGAGGRLRRISTYSPEKPARPRPFCGPGHALPDPPAVYNMFDRWVENGLLDVLDEEGIGCIAFSPLAQGLLTDKYLRDIPEGSRAEKLSGQFHWGDKVSEARAREAAQAE